MSRSSVTASSASVSTEFASNGFVIVRRLFQVEEVALMRQALEQDPAFSAHAFPRVDAQGEVAQVTVWNHPGGGVFGLVARSRRIVDSMQSFLCGEVYHYHSKITSKDPLIGGSWDWHQDYAYWYHNGCLFPMMANAFVAIDRATRDNGCLELIPRSHELGRIDHVALDGEGRRLSVAPDELAKNTHSRVAADPERVDWAIARLGCVYCELEPGDVCFFHGNMLHRSGPNRSDVRRAALISVYNAAFNDPAKAHHHPGYTPLIPVPDHALITAGCRFADGSEQFLEHPGRPR